MFDMSQLSPTAEKAVRWFVRELANGLTGRVSFECNDGGIRLIEDSRKRHPDELVDDARGTPLK